MLTAHRLAAAALRAILAASLLAASSAWAAPFPGRWEPSATAVFRHARLLNDIAPTAIQQDRDGLIWIGSQTGLVSWDGYRSRQYIADPNLPGSLPAAFVNALHEDRQGRLWVGTDSGGLARLDKDSGHFTSIGTGATGLSSARVFSLADDDAQGLWVGTAQGLDRLDTATGRVRRHVDGGIPPGLAPQRISALLRDSRGNLWVGTYQGLHVLSAGAPAFQAVSTDAAAVEVRRLVEDSAGRVWVGTRESGAFIIEPGATSARQLQDSRHTDKKVQTDWVSAIVDVGEHRVWLGTWGQGIVEVDTRTWATRRLRHDPEVPASLAQDTVLALLRDRSGLVWASGPNLLDSHDPAQHAVSTWFGGGRLLGGAKTQIDAVLARRDGTVWLGNLSGGIDIIPPDGGPSRRLLPRDGEPLDALPKASVIALAEAPDGSVYIGTSKGLYRARDDGQRLERLAFRGLAPNTQIKELCISGHQLWMGVAPGLRQVDLSQPDAQAELVAGLEQDDIITVACDRGDTLWVGTSTGLARLRPAPPGGSTRVERPWPEAPGRVGLPKSSVSSVVRDARGRLWVAFYGGGVRVVESEAGDGRIHRIGPEQGLTHNAANALLLDAQGNAWVSTDDGLLHIDGRTFATTPLQQAEGVGLLGYWQAAAKVTPEGDLLFGSNGLTVVHPTEFRPRRFEAPILLTDAQGRQVPATGIGLGPTQRAVQFSFALLDYAAPERTRYTYRLAGLEEGWTESPAELRIARYTNVPPGDYSFEVKAINGAGVQTLAQWPLHVQPAWHETTAFRALLALLALALVTALVRLRTRLLERRAAVLSQQVAQRTQELQQRTDELELRSAELHRSEKRLERLAYHDSLTGLANRRRFTEELQRWVAQAHRGKVFALMLLDLDRFKPINDVHGHDAGDAVLVQVGARLTEALREVDLVARLGGDEFALLLHDPAGRGAVEMLCRRVVKALAEPVSYQGVALRVGTSAGVAMCPADGHDADTLYKSADLALYAAKQAGRGVWRWGTAPDRATSGAIDVNASGEVGQA